VVEAVFFREVGVFVGGDVLFRWRVTLSAGLTTSRDGRRFEGDAAGANPGVGSHEHQRVPLFGESSSRGGWGIARVLAVRLRAAMWVRLC